MLYASFWFLIFFFKSESMKREVEEVGCEKLDKKDEKGSMLVVEIPPGERNHES